MGTADDRTWEPPAVPAGTIVYHYTSPTGLVGILTNRELWASEASTLNDLSEVKGGRKRVRAYVDAQLKASHDDDGAIQSLSDALSDRYRLRPGRRPSTFVLCASQERDDAAQWRLYCGGRGGFAVHLDTSHPLQVIAPPGRHHAAQDPMWTKLGFSSVVSRWYPVAYTAQQKRLLLDDLVAWVRRRDEIARDDIDATANHPDREIHWADIVDEHGLALASAVDLASALMKPKGFRAEREVRAVAYAAMPENLVSYRANDELPVPYLRVAQSQSTATSDSAMNDVRDKKNGRPDRTLPIVGVTIGPTSQFGDINHTVRMLLDTADLKVTDIRKSKVPLRW